MMATASLPDFTPDQPAAQVDAALRQALAACDRARECAVLWFAEVQRRQLFRSLGHASLELYAVRALGFSRNRFWQFKRLADDLERLPALRQAVTDGELGWTKAQQVARVANEATQATWVEKAKATGRRELEREVMAARKRRPRTASSQPELVGGLAPAQVEVDPPTTITLRADGLQLARFEALVEQARKRRLVPAGADRMDLVLSALAALVEGGPARTGPATQIVIHQCPDCGDAAAVTSRGEKRLAPAHAAAAACDARVQREGRPNRATIPPATRGTVLARDRHRCTTPGCGSTQFLEIHHVRPRSAGGSNKPENLVTLCGRCHRFAHEGLAPAQAAAAYSTDTSCTSESPPATCTTMRNGPASAAGMSRLVVSV